MSDEDKPLEFSAFDLMPDWAQESPSSPSKERSARRSDGADDERGKGRRDDRRGGRHDGRRGGRPDGRRGGGDRRGGGRDFGGGDRRGGNRRGGPHRGGRRDDRRERREEEPLPPGITAKLEPTEATVQNLSKHIRETLRAFPLADLAKMILKGRDRYQIRFETDENVSNLFRCKSDNSLWMSREEAVNHILNSKALENYYAVEEVDVGAPSGNFTQIAVCGMSGEILGPPNHHEYQRNVIQLHAQRFANMPIEKFKSRIVMESGEEILKKWKEQVSKKKQYRVKRGDADTVAEEEPGEVGSSESEESVDSRSDSAATEAGDESKEAAGEAPDAEEAASGEPAPEGEEEQEETEADEPEEAGAEDTSGNVAEATEDVAAESEGSEEPDGESGDAAEVEGGGDAEDAEAEAGEEEGQPGEEDADSAAEGSEESGGSEDAPAADEGPAIGSREELARHFRENFAEEAIEEASTAVVSGDISARDLSRGLLAHLKQESEKLRKGFPLPMIQALCSEFEKEGLRFFKRGKKALHVSAVRPRPINESVSFTDQVQAIVDQVVSRSSTKVMDLLDELADDFTPPEKNAPTDRVELTDGAKAVLKDLRWLTSEGYLIEFPDTRLVLGKNPASGNQPPAKKKGAEAKKKAASRKSDQDSGPAKEEAPTDAPEGKEKEADAVPPGDADAGGEEETPKAETVAPVEEGTEKEKEPEAEAGAEAKEETEHSDESVAGGEKTGSEDPGASTEEASDENEDDSRRM